MEGTSSYADARVLVSRLLTKHNINSYMSTLNEERPEVFRHCINVAYLVAEIVMNPHFAEIKKVDDKYVEDIVTGALLHDIGKLKISESILMKPDVLTEEEYRQCQMHPIYGYEMIKDDDSFSNMVKDIVLSHHEKADGTGYPYHKKAAAVNIETQIVSACDIYDAITEARSYREASDMTAAFRILACEPICLDVFLSLVSCRDK